jgi:tetratricopeptide (TPR) repeat protein
MTAASVPSAPDARAALNAARFVFSPESTAPVPEVWAHAQRVLRAVTMRPELSGQALIAEARRVGALALSDAHVLVALTTLADASEQPAHDASEGGLLPSAWSALERAVLWASASAPPASVPLRAAPPETAPLMPSPLALSPPATSSPAVSRRWPVARVVGVVLAMLAVGAAVWGVRTTRADRSYRAGVDAYRRGAREVARTAFAKAAQQRPGDVRALVYLGRMLREDGEMARARTLLTTAVRRDPTNALATRELASAMLADGQPDLARRFYVRALQLNPTDRIAQGFLSCALFRLQRVDEARKWAARAGAGDWSRCGVPASTVPTSTVPSTPVTPR